MHEESFILVDARIQMLNVATIVNDDFAYKSDDSFGIFSRPTCKVAAVVCFQKESQKIHFWCGTHSQSKCDIGVGAVLAFLSSQKRAFRNDAVDVWGYYLHICVEVDATMVVKNPNAGIIAYESVFLEPIRFFCVCRDVDVEVVFVPFFYFIVGKIFFPLLDALLCQFREGRMSKPTIMNNFRNHRLMWVICNLLTKLPLFPHNGKCGVLSLLACGVLVM